MSGYGLARLFERTLARAWPARHPQIYPALGALEEQGLLRVSETGPRRRRRTRSPRTGSPEGPARGCARPRPIARFATRRSCGSSCSGSSRPPRRSPSSTTRSSSHRAASSPVSSRRSQTTNASAREHGTAQGGIAFCASLALEWGIRYEREYIEWATQARDRIAIGAKAWDDARAQRLDRHKATA